MIEATKQKTGSTNIELFDFGRALEYMFGVWLKLCLYYRHLNQSTSFTNSGLLIHTFNN